MNPFLNQHELKVIKIKNKSYVTDISSINPNDIAGDTEEITKSFLVEEQPKVSMYHIPWDNNVLFKDQIKSNGRDLFLYIAYNIKTNEDTIILKSEKVMKNMNISRATLYTAISQLVDASVIVKKSVSEYWINPYFLFKGNRIQYYKTNKPDQIKIVYNKPTQKLMTSNTNQIILPNESF